MMKDDRAKRFGAWLRSMVRSDPRTSMFSSRFYAQRAAMNPSQWSRYENGAVLPSRVIVIRIAHSLQIDTNEALKNAGYAETKEEV